MESAFQNVTKKRSFSRRIIKGFRFNILDVELHPDAIHRRGVKLYKLQEKNIILLK
jgi:hypothetical protein